MGILGLPLYGTDLGTAIEATEKLLAKIKSGKYDKETLIEIIIPAYILNKWFEAVFFFICHWIIRNQFKYQYHCPTHAQCRIVTTVIFVVGMAIIIPIRFSLLSIIFLCYTIAYVGQLQKRYNTSVVKLERLTAPKLFDCETCSESELIERCDELRLSKDNK